MRRNEKRHANGPLLPNVYFLLQVGAVGLLLSIFLQISKVYQISDVTVFISYVISAIAIMYFLVKRKTAIQRQDLYHSENKKN